MIAEELLSVIRRDIGLQLKTTLQFKGGSNFASNLKLSSEVAAEVEAWLDSLMKDNSLAGYQDGIYAGTRQDWQDRCQGAEAKLSKIQVVLNG